MPITKITFKSEGFRTLNTSAEAQAAVMAVAESIAARAGVLRVAAVCLACMFPPWIRGICAGEAKRDAAGVATTTPTAWVAVGMVDLTSS